MKILKMLSFSALSLLFVTPAIGQLKVISNGNVGIGTSTPGQKLEVAGIARIRGTFIQLGADAGNAEASVLTGFQRQQNGNAGIKFYTVSGSTFNNPTTTFGADAIGGGALNHRGAGTLNVATAANQALRFSVNSTNKVSITGANNANFGFVGINTNTPAHQLEVNGDASKPGGGSWTTASDKRLKKDVKPYTDGLAKVLAINPVTFKYNGMGGIPDNGKEYVGVIAQEMQEVAPYTISTFVRDEIEFINNEDQVVPQERIVSSKEYLSYDGTAVTYMLVNAIKEQQQLIDEKDAQIEDLAARLERMERTIANLTSTGTGSNAGIQTVNLNNVTEYLVQNQPNPFTQSTKITYTLPTDSKTAFLRVTDSNGRLIKQITLAADIQKGEVILNAGELAPGTYAYSLIVNGNTLDSKQMVLVR
jgi:hypothetical protein